MGYCMSQRDVSFFIDKKDKQAALEAIKNQFHYHRAYTSDTLESILERWGWKTETDEDGDIYDIFFEGQKLGSDFTLFKTIAPFVKEGSFIEMDGEDNTLWRWVFDGKTCKEIYPTIDWEQEK